MVLTLKAEETLIYGRYDLILRDHDQVFAYTRTLGSEKFIILTNLFNEKAEFELPESLQDQEFQLRLSNNDDNPADQTSLMPYEARVYQLI
ncbi:hypothetical protein G4V62_02030 [Bacillaceae bacterium SIJ1]|uniref:alpha-glucosidase C-terminal domain-containing protein n=1 Tax=Litoribacterium kuwaitense TaxID=1398745 RepID=UPI0013EC34C9|nr:alpha-glucosidase C-terminal domain-containing protein [Litoribacterium kuwaitense]NGP43785.1 hypothetical protein [Litoribacterium kuwaitense]